MQLTMAQIQKALRELYGFVGNQPPTVETSPMLRRIYQALMHDRNVDAVLGRGPIVVLGVAKPEDDRKWIRVSML